MSNKEILEKHGWVIVCDSPFNIEHEDGSLATGLAAYIVLGDCLKREKQKTKKKKRVLEKTLKNWDVYKSPNGNTFIKFGDKYAIAIGSKNSCTPDKETKYCPNANRNFDHYTLPCVANASETLEVKKIGKVKFK